MLHRVFLDDGLRPAYVMRQSYSALLLFQSTAKTCHRHAQESVAALPEQLKKIRAEKLPWVILTEEERHRHPEAGRRPSLTTAADSKPTWKLVLAPIFWVLHLSKKFWGGVKICCQRDPEKKNKKTMGSFPSPRHFWANQCGALWLSWFNILLLAVPIGWAAHWFKVFPRWSVSAINFVAILPLAKMIGDATEDIGKYHTQAFAGLLNATLG